MTDQLLDRLIVAVGTQYLVDAEIGRGGMAVVYRATDLRLHRRVAIKVLPPELAFNADVRERFLREAQTSAGLTHPGIVPIYSVDEREGIVYFVMALVEGESLAERLAREPRLPVADARSILAGVAEALAYAHGQGVVHRDIKPDNIMIERGTNRCVVTDFGIARAAQGDTRLTVTGVAIGTPAYMSPEQALGERELDGRSDIYSLGVIGYQLLAGQTPFRASNTPAMLVKHVSETPRPLNTLRPDAPMSLVNAIARALAKRPEDRWSNATEFRAALLDTRPDAPAWVPPRQALPAEPARERSAMDEPHLLAPYPREDRWGSNPRDIMRASLDVMPPMPPAPAWGDKREWREWRKSRRRWEMEMRRRSRALGRQDGDIEFAGLTVDEQVARFRRKAISSVATIGLLGTINVLTSSHFLWFLFPTAIMAIDTLTRGGKLWADGIPFRKLFSRGSVEAIQARATISQFTPGAEMARIAPPDVLNGPYGPQVQRASQDYAAVKDMLARLPESERSLIPDVGPTVDALIERVGALATTLHRLDADVGGSSTKLLDARIAALRVESRGEPSAEQERRIALLERQRASIGELAARRGTLASQLESATLALQNLRLDLLKLRSSGLESAMSDVASATQEARALSRQIGHAVDAMREVNRL